MGLLIAAALLWVGVHVGVAGTALRGRLAAVLGENGFRLAFSVASVVAIALLVAGYGAAQPAAVLWVAPAWLRWLLVLLMLPAFVLFACSLRGNPTAVGGEALLGAKPAGVQRVTRHPMLWSFALWAAVHLLGNGDAASVAFFGAFLVTALAGMPSIDAKLAARAPAAWSRLSAATSILPFGAIAAGRNRLALGEIGWAAPLAGVAAWLALLLLHRTLFGVPPAPGLG